MHYSYTPTGPSGSDFIFHKYLNNAPPTTQPSALFSTWMLYKRGSWWMCPLYVPARSSSCSPCRIKKYFDLQSYFLIQLTTTCVALPISSTLVAILVAICPGSGTGLWHPLIPPRKLARLFFNPGNCCPWKQHKTYSDCWEFNGLEAG